MSTAPAAGGTRVALAGKGGVGKTTLAGLLSLVLAERRWSVLAVDADEQRNLGPVLGLDDEAAAAVVPVAASGAYLEEKTGATPEASGVVRLNPDVGDVAERLAVDTPAGVRLLVMGGVDRAGGGCLCPQHALVGAAVRGMRLQVSSVVLMDTHAGVEHFGRALARGFDQLLVVVDPTANAVRVGVDTARLADELGIGTLHLLVNRVREPGDVGRVLERAEAAGDIAFSSVSAVPWCPEALAVDGPVAPLLGLPPLRRAVEALADLLLAGAPAAGRRAG